MRLRIPGFRAAEIHVDFAEGHEILGTKAQRAILKRYITPRKVGKERVHPKVLFSTLSLMSIAPMLQNMKTDLRRKP